MEKRRAWFAIAAYVGKANESIGLKRNMSSVEIGDAVEELFDAVLKAVAERDFAKRGLPNHFDACFTAAKEVAEDIGIEVTKKDKKGTTAVPTLPEDTKIVLRAGGMWFGF